MSYREHAKECPDCGRWDYLSDHRCPQDTDRAAKHYTAATLAVIVQRFVDGEYVSREAAKAAVADYHKAWEIQR